MLSVVVSSCAASTSAGHSQPSMSPAPILAAACALVSPADLATAFHHQFPAGTKASADGEINNECVFVLQGDPAKVGLVAVEVVSGDMASQFYANGQHKLNSYNSVSGVGDRALLETDGNAILAIKGHIAIFVAALLSDETAADLGDGCVLLAKFVFSKTSS